LLNLLLIFQRELLFYDFLEVTINIMKVILLFEEVGNWSSANWAGALVVQMGSHALDAESVHTWKDARFDHQVKAHTAIRFHSLIFILIKLLKNRLNMALY